MGWISEASSLGDMFVRNCGRYSDRTAYLIPGKDGYSSVTYAEALETALRYARAIDALGVHLGEAVALVSESSFEWAMVDWACQILGVVLVPIYPTLPADQAQYIADDCEAKLVVAQDDRQGAKITGRPVVELGDEGLLSHDSGMTREALIERSRSISRNQTATIIYTSGTTGQPKGAELCHAGFLDISQAITETYGIRETDTFFSFLPLSHVFERYAGHVLPISVGAAVAYAGSIAALAGNLQKVRPTIMCAVPRFLENLRLRILDGTEKQPPLKQRLFHMGLRQGALRASGKFAPFHWLTDALVGKKVRALTGGRMRFFVSGGAALAPQVSEFYIAFGLTVLQGYGLTETTAATCLNLPEDNRPWTVGPPLSCVEVSLAKDGEILVRGTSVMKGYYHLPEATAEALDKDGWFHTGDIGEFEGSRLKITDRKKDILVLANGKNVAPQKIEAKLKEGEYVSEVVLFGDGMEYVCALIVPEFERLKPWLKERGHQQTDPAEIVELQDVKDLLKAQVDAANKELADFERVKRHRLLGTVFSVDSGELTPSLKVKRKYVREKYKAEVESMDRS